MPIQCTAWPWFCACVRMLMHNYRSRHLLMQIFDYLIVSLITWRECILSFIFIPLAFDACSGFECVVRPILAPVDTPYIPIYLPSHSYTGPREKWTQQNDYNSHIIRIRSNVWWKLLWVIDTILGKMFFFSHILWLCELEYLYFMSLCLNSNEMNRPYIIMFLSRLSFFARSPLLR